MSKELLIQNIKYIKSSKKMTFKFMSGILKIPGRTIERWFNGNKYPTTIHLSKISNHFKISIDDLCRKDLSKTKQTTVYSKYWFIKKLINQNK